MQTIRYYAAAIIAAMLFVAGCSDSKDSENHQEAIEQTRTSGQMLRSGSQRIQLNDSEFEQIKSETESSSARPMSDAQRERYAERIVNRIEQSGDFSGLEEIDGLVASMQKAETPEQMQASQVQLMSLCNTLLEQSDQVDDVLREKRIQQINQARTKLNQAIATARSSNFGNLAAGANLLLGTLNLVSARDEAMSMREHDIAIQQKQNRLTQLLLALIKQNTVLESVDAYLPADVVADLTERLNGEQGYLAQVKKLEQQQAAMAELEQQLQKEIESNEQQARKLYQQYLTLMEMSEKQRGKERYDLQEQAYYLLAGDDTQKGSLYYEAQAEMLQSQLTNTEVSLESIESRLANVQELVKVVKKQLKEIQDADSNTRVAMMKANALEQGQAIAADIVNYQEKVLMPLEDAYNAARVSAVERFQDALNAFGQAGQVRTSRPLKRLADSLAGIINNELLVLWNNDQLHYRNKAAALELLEGARLNAFAELSRQAAEWRRNAEKLAEQAGISADSLRSDEEETAGDDAGN